MKKGCIAVFAKTPDLSPVKTRLAQTIGKDKAKEIYTLCVESVQAVLQEIKHPGWDIRWALAEEEAGNTEFWHHRPFEKFWTGEGELGDRHLPRRTPRLRRAEQLARRIPPDPEAL